MDVPPATPPNWAALMKVNPETVAATRKHWYTIPTASKSGFFESALPDHAARGWDTVMDEFIRTHAQHAHVVKRPTPSLAGLQLSFMMCQLAQNKHYEHLKLPELAAEAEKYLAERTDAAERRRAIEARLEGHDLLADAYARGMDAVYNLAGLSPSEAKVAAMLMAGDTQDQIMEKMDYKNKQSASSVIVKIMRKLSNLVREKEARAA